MMPLQLFSGKQFKRTKNIKFSSEGENVINYEFYDSARFTKAEIKGDTFYYEIEDPRASKDREYGIAVKHIDPKYDFGFSFSLAMVSYDKMSGEIPVEDLKLNSMFAFPYSSSEDALNINRFIEPLYLTGTYYFSLCCYEKDKTNYSSNSLLSDQMSTKVYYKGVDSLNEGDKLIADRKVEEAMKWYEDNMSEHNLKVLISLYSEGYKAVDGEFYQTLEGANISKAIKYSEIFIESYGESQRILERLQYLYKDIYDFENERKVLEKMLDIHSSVYTYFELGINSINQGMFNEGLKIIKEHIDEHDGNKERYYFPYLILSNKVSDLPVEYRLELTELEEYKELHNLIVKGKYIEAWDELQSKPESDVKKMYTLLMIESFDLKELEFEEYKKQHGIDDDLDFHDYYIDETVKIKDKNIKSILKLLKEENNWF